ncbi:hypothetical protein [Lysinibacillus sphaericus]|uniref:hypothetical protein n=1 Tax=Lysinibacillus sphaericus TaxID=1421 RepID=UPI001CC0F891|nr:hypothetical protein [Lysinibacillus sphaericus]
MCNVSETAVTNVLCSESEASATIVLCNVSETAVTNVLCRESEASAEIPHFYSGEINADLIYFSLRIQILAERS